jgi:hypothetical protein
MSSQQERVARNEATTRQINDDIKRAHQDASPRTTYGSCASAGGRTATGSSPSPWPSTRRCGPTLAGFAVAHDHVVGDEDQVVAGTDRYAVVAKRKGTPAEVAAEEDPHG